MVTLADGRRYLIHKAEYFGDDIIQRTIIEPGDVTSNGDWTRTDSKPVSSSNVLNYLYESGGLYDPIFDNCHDASKRMMDLD